MKNIRKGDSLSKIRILQIVTRLVVRGVPRHVLNIAERLDSNRFSVDVLAGSGLSQEGSLWEEAQSRGIKINQVASLQRAIDPKTDITALVALYKKIKQGRYHIVHTHISKAGILGRLAARIAGTPVILHTYHGEVDELRDGSFKSGIFIACERITASVSDALVAVSKHTAQILKSKNIGGRHKYCVIPNSIDLNHFHTNEPSKNRINTPRLGVIASLTHEKGIDILLQALPSLLKNHPNLHLEILGDGPLRALLYKQTQQLDLNNNVKFLGNVENVRARLSTFDLVVAPSRREGLPTALLEAMAMECPVVASRIGGILELVQDEKTGILVPPENPDALGSAIDHLLQNASKCEELGRNARIVVEKRYSLKNMIQCLETLYLDLLTQNGAI